jgi:hypothetical protein
MRRCLTILAVVGASGLLPGSSSAQTTRYALESAKGLALHDAVATAVTHQGKKGLELRLAPSIARDQPHPALLVRLGDGTFSNGVIEAEIAGVPAAGASDAARGFVGIAFRVQPDDKTYDAFYLRPTNGRAEDQERRNHAAQYISHPDWTWSRLRQETPSRYESYVDILPDTWTRIRIEVHGVRARLYVNGQQQPTLIVNDVKSGATARGAVALWFEAATIAHFRNVLVTQDTSAP